jgi:hypothetical protein
MSERIYWNEIEKDKLCETTFGIFTNNPEGSLIQAINKAMEMMPPYRRRKIVTLGSVPWLLDYVKLKIQELKNYRKKVIAAEPPPLPTTDELLKKATTQQLMVTIIERLLTTQDKTLATLEELRKDIQNVLCTGPTGPTGAASLTKKDLTPKLGKKKFVVVGLKPNQANEVKDRFADNFGVEFEFLETNKFRGLPSCDTVFVMTGFVDHSVYNLIKKARPDVSHVNGGVSGLVNRIKEHV